MLRCAADKRLECHYASGDGLGRQHGDAHHQYRLLAHHQPAGGGFALAAGWHANQRRELHDPRPGGRSNGYRLGRHVDANGNTNYFNGLVGRDGIFWVENVPLSAGTNCLALTLSNPAGTTTTNFTLIQSSVGLSVNAVQAGDTTVSGSIGADGYTIWVNGTNATLTIHMMEVGRLKLRRSALAGGLSR